VEAASEPANARRRGSPVQPGLAACAWRRARSCATAKPPAFDDLPAPGLWALSS